MATIRKIVYDIREGVKQYQDDTELDDRWIIYLYNNKRAKYLRQDLNNLQKVVDNSVLQKFCLELEEVNVDECGLSYECETIVRSKQPIPKPLDLNLGSAITSVKPNNKIALSFNFVNKERAILSKYSPFKNNIYAFIDTDLYIYLISESDTIKLMECITVTGVFEDPLELSNYKNCCGCNDAVSCFDEDVTEYPLQAHHIDYIREELIQSIVRTMQIPEDKINNANDD